ncbi:MAG: HAD family hydrolase [Syntrophobacterales bacterium]|nr:HAD family hydrolase [Syntrophobacterales bacterium]
MVPRFSVVAFDCDGVIFDSRKANELFYNAVLTKMGLEAIRPDQIEVVHMLSVRESLEFLVGKKRLEEAISVARSIDFGLFNRYLKLEPGLKECLSLLKPLYKLAVATNRTTSTHEVLRYFDLHSYFDLIVCALDVPRPKPHADMLERVIWVFNVAPHQVIYVGDSIVDSECAKGSGVFFVAYKNPRIEADLYVNSFDELMKWLKNDVSHVYP